MIALLMGVTGSGKTTIGRLLAKRLGAVFADADDFHSSENKAKMAEGIPLSDADRQPWLLALNGLMRGWFEAGTTGVLACSALKEGYRQTLSSGLPEDAVTYVFLDGSKELFAARLAGRHHEYMNPRLLESQIDTLERPKDGLRVVNDRAPEDVVGDIVGKMTQASG